MRNYRRGRDEQWWWYEIVSQLWEIKFEQFPGNIQGQRLNDMKKSNRYGIMIIQN